MSLCLGKRGKWCIYAKYPVFSPKKIRYRYPGGQWQEIAGDTYSIEQTPARIEYLYRPHAVTRLTGNWGITEAYVTGSQFVGEYIGWEWTNPLDTVSGGPGSLAINIIFRVTSGAVDKRDLRPTGPAWMYVNPNSTRSLVWLELRPSNPVIISPAQCRFRVFSQSNQVILDIQSQDCPETETIPESCTFSNPEVFVREYMNSNISSYAIILPDPNNSKCVFVNVAIPSDPLIETPPFVNLAYLCGDCAAPQIRIDCECDPCFDKRCPAGTVNRILVGNSIQCVGADHCVLETIPYDPSCETPNCFC